MMYLWRKNYSRMFDKFNELCSMLFLRYDLEEKFAFFQKFIGVILLK